MIISLVKRCIIEIKKYVIWWLNEELELDKRIMERYEQQRQQILYLSQRVHALNKPIVEAQSRNIHFPTLDDLTYKYQLFQQSVWIKPSDQTLSLDIKGFGLHTDYRYVDQANHRLYMKIVSGTNESVWYNCCEKIQAIGLVEKDGCFCVRNDKMLKSTPYQRWCYIPSSEINGECIVFLRFGKKNGQNLSCESIVVS